MINKDMTITVGDLLKLLADGRVTVDMPVTFWDSSSGTVRGIAALEIYTYRDGTKAITITDGASVADVKDAAYAGELYL